jgi:imidazolonepropionase
MAASLGALSADHLERLDQAGVEAMAAAGTVANLLPGAMLYLKDPPPPVAALRTAGVPFAVSTDLNPGSSPVNDLWACATLACIAMGLTVEEAVMGITRGGAQALGRSDLGVVRPGSTADLAFYRPLPGEPATVEPMVQYLVGRRAEVVLRGGRIVRDTRGV